MQHCCFTTCSESGWKHSDLVLESLAASKAHASAAPFIVSFAPLLQHGVDDMRIAPYDDMLKKELKPNEVRIKVASVGICGSDVHYLKHMRIGSFIVKEPMVSHAE
jgi:hypothetical protein